MPEQNAADCPTVSCRNRDAACPLLWRLVDLVKGHRCAAAGLGHDLCARNHSVNRRGHEIPRQMQQLASQTPRHGALQCPRNRVRHMPTFVIAAVSVVLP